MFWNDHTQFSAFTEYFTYKILSITYIGKKGSIFNNNIFHFSAKPVIIDKVQKCITCGGPIANNPKRKGPKLIRCENCIAQDSVEQRNNQSELLLVFGNCVLLTKLEITAVI